MPSEDDRYKFTAETSDFFFLVAMILRGYDTRLHGATM